jgi:hypothetical protein
LTKSRNIYKATHKPTTIDKGDDPTDKLIIDKIYLKKYPTAWDLEVIKTSEHYLIIIIKSTCMYVIAHDDL